MSPLLLEINTRCWLHELSEHNEAPITLATVPEAEFEHWKSLGFSHIWLMGAWANGPRGRACALAQPELRRICVQAFGAIDESILAGSPYAISAYTVPDELGGERGLATFRKHLHQHGLKLILDFVPNHVGLDHPWLESHPEVFVQSPRARPETFLQQSNAGPTWIAHGKDPYFPAWTDTAQLDYRLNQTRATMAAVLQSVAARCDGVRCDMAMLLLNDIFARTWEQFPARHDPPTYEFWADAIQSVRQAHPEFLFIAEAYWDTEPRLQELGFDYTYDKPWLDNIVRHEYSALQKRVRASNGKSIRFLENHDEPRIASRLTPPEQKALALFLLAQPGARLVYHGQLHGRRLHTPVHFTRYLPEKPDLQLCAYYEELLLEIRRSGVGRGDAATVDFMTNSGAIAEDCLVLRWQEEPNRFYLVAINLAPQHRPGVVLLPRTPGNWTVRELISNQLPAPPSLNATGLALDLPAHTGLLLELLAPG